MKRFTAKEVLVLGSGQFGVCLAHRLALNGYKVQLWTHKPETAAQIQSDRIIPALSSLGYRLPQGIRVVSNEIDFSQLEGLVVVLPTQVIRAVISRFSSQIPKNISIISASKGIEADTLLFPTQILREVLPHTLPPVALSGPSFAVEVVRNCPTAVVAASTDPSQAEWAQKIFHDSFFRVYTSTDPIGVEVCGALKNVIAIISGMGDKLNLGRNSTAAILTRGFGEMMRIGLKMGANPLTFNGLAGFGDLYLTCTSPLSRNYRFGAALATGESVEKILAEMGSVVEGYHTTASALHLVKKLNLECPVIETLYGIIYKKIDLNQAIQSLMDRTPKSEFYGQDQ